MKLHGIASLISHDVEDFRLTREEAEAVLAEVLADEPELAAALYVAEIEISGSEN